LAVTREVRQGGSDIACRVVPVAGVRPRADCPAEQTHRSAEMRGWLGMAIVPMRPIKRLLPSLRPGLKHGSSLGPGQSRMGSVP
jgi:hypothetical protein